MTVKELIAILRKLPKDLLVVKSKDEEGNGFEEVSEWSLGAYTFEEYQHEFTSYTCDDEGNDVLLPDDDCNAVCLW